MAPSYDIVALLERAASAEAGEPTFEPSPGPDHVPLTFSQVAHWNLYQLGQRPAIRQIACATRLLGRLDLDALRSSAAWIFRRHDALRTRIVIYDGLPTQEIDETRDCELNVEELSGLPESFREVEVLRLIESFILKPIDVAAGPLSGVLLLRLGENEHVLIVAMEHMVSDAFSMDILLRELLATYAQILRGRAVSLPKVLVQFGEFALLQRRAQGSLLEKHGPYWNAHLAGCHRVTFPPDYSSLNESRSGWGTVPVQIGRDLKLELRKWCRRMRTTLVMSVLAAYIGLTLRWCNVSEAVIQFQTDGRVSPAIENTIGYFASVLYLRIQCLERDTFVDLLKRIIDEYCKAYEHADYSYMEAQVPRPEFTRNTCFNWVPQGSKVDLSDLDGSEDAIACYPLPFAHPMLRNLERDTEPVILLYDTDGDTVGGIHFPLNRLSKETMERFGRNFLVFIGALLRQPEGRIKDISLLQ